VTKKETGTRSPRPAALLLPDQHGLVANVCATAAVGAGECEADLTLLEILAHGGTVGATRALMSNVGGRRPNAGHTPHVAQKTHSVVGGRTTRHRGDAVGQRKRKLI
jgi:hypothetical protein